MSDTIIKMKVIEADNLICQSIKVSEPLSMKVSEGTGSKVIHYSGSCDIVPKVVDQIIPTENKYLDTNVTVEKIPKHEVSNESGTTIVIGGIL